MSIKSLWCQRTCNCPCGHRRPTAWVPVEDFGDGGLGGGERGDDGLEAEVVDGAGEAA